MSIRFRKQIILSVMLALSMSIIILTCGKDEGPSRDEIPLIKNTLAQLEDAVKNHNALKIDSLISPEALGLGYSPEQILADIYPDSSKASFLSFGDRNFLYVEDKALVNCLIISDTTDPGRPVEITLAKNEGVWLIKKFDLK